ncbi:hypothetical protein HOH87_04075 [bacterium]|jgi:hypothetical protein|nr:hypothetical protein [bacterium]
MTTQLKKVISMAGEDGSESPFFEGYANVALSNWTRSDSLDNDSRKRMRMTEYDSGLRELMMKELETLLETYTEGTIFFTVPDCYKDKELCKSVKLVIKPEVLKMRDNGTVKGYVISIIDSPQDAVGHGIFVLPMDIEEDDFPIFQLGLTPNKDRLEDFAESVDAMFRGRNFIFYV